MYIFSRTGTIVPGHFVEGTTFAIEVAAQVKTITGVNVNVYRVGYGYPLGTVIWTSRIGSQAELADIEAKLYADAGYLETVDRHGHLFTGGGSDGLSNVVSSTIATPKPLVAVTQAVIANGKFAKAMALGVMLQEHVAKITGLTTAFAVDTYGTYGSVRWLIAADTMAEVDHADQVMATDAEFHALVEQAGDLFNPGGQTTLITQIN